MKHLILLITGPLLFLNTLVSAQNVAQTKKMLQGLWALGADHSVTIAISGDSVMEYKMGEREMAVLNCRLSRESCDTESIKSSPTGIFFSMVSDGGNIELCAAIGLLDNKYLWLQVDKNSFIEFEKLL
jgi:hypothetical protein